MQACRLIEQNSESLAWHPKLCSSCSIPDILRANSADTLKLDAKVVNKFLGLKQVVEVTGWCSECFNEVPDPMLGCRNCDQTHHSSILDLEEGPG